MKDQNIKDLSISDLKASFDFVSVIINEIKIKAKNEGVEYKKIQAYNEVRELERKLYDELQNRVRFLA